MLIPLAQALGVAYAAGINLYATIAILGLASRAGWIDALPSALGVVGNGWVIALALALSLFEFLATLVPGVGSAWETFHSIVRPPAAAVLAAAVAWQGDALLVLAATLLGGGLAVTTHATKLGLRYAIDTSPEPVNNGVANVAELGLVAAVVLFIWQYPFVTLAIALLLLLALVLMVRAILRVLRQVLSGHWMPGCGLLQDPRASAERPVFVEEEED